MLYPILCNLQTASNIYDTNIFSFVIGNQPVSQMPEPRQKLYLSDLPRLRYLRFRAVPNTRGQFLFRSEDEPQMFLKHKQYHLSIASYQLNQNESFVWYPQTKLVLPGNLPEKVLILAQSSVRMPQRASGGITGAGQLLKRS